MFLTKRKAVTAVTVLALLATLAAAAPADKAAGPTDDHARLQGNWTAVSGEQDGQKLADDAVKGVRVTFDGDEVSFFPKQDKSRVTFRLESAGTPRGLTMTAQEGPDKGKSIPGIYELQGDRLKLCVALKPGTARPPAFAAPADSGLLLLVLRREGNLVAAERARLQGIWKVVAAEVGGQDALDNFLKNSKLVIRGDRATLSRGDYTSVPADFTVDPTQKPKTLDMVARGGPEYERGKTRRAIYKLDGDTLTVCVNGPDLERPTEFKSPEGTQVMLLTLKRRPTAADRTQEDRQRLQGAWEVVALERNGTKAPEGEKPLGARVVFKEDRLVNHFNDNNPMEADYKIDAGQDPGHIDVTPRDGPEQEKGKTFHGIYRLKGDTLTLCLSARPDGDRPTEFKTAEGSDTVLFTLKRAAPAK